MRLLRMGILALFLVSAALAAQTTQQLPADHPQVNQPGNRSNANSLTEQLRPSGANPGTSPVPRKNIIDEFIFGKMEKDGIPHAPLASDEEFFRRVHIDLTGRIPRDDELRAFLESKEPDKRDKLVDRLTSGRPYETKWAYFFNDIYKPHSNRVGVHGLLNCGFLPATYTPFHVDTTIGASTFSMDDGGRKEFMRRWELLKTFDERLRNDSSLQAKAFRDYHNHYEGAVSMMSDTRASEIFKIDPADHDRYGKTLIGDGCVIARNLVEADAGTHFIIVNQTFWDHHGGIYRENSHPNMSRDLDAALANLMLDLDSRRRPDGRSLLDETMIVCFGEFGRTPGELNPGRGRDHYQYAYTGLFAGGGIKGGRIVGKTDELGAKIIESGWETKRSVYMEDIATTMYSALGIDWSKVIDGTPSGRAFHYIEPFAAKTMIANREIAPLFA